VNRLILIFFCCSLTTIAGADSSNGVVKALSLSQCLEIAARNNFDVQIEQKGIEMARHELRKSYGVYDPVLRAGVSRGDSLSAGGIDDQNRAYPGTQTRRDNVYGGVTGLLPTGLEYDLGGDVADSRGTGPFGRFENAGGTAGIRLRQPLLRDFWVDSQRVTIQISRTRLRVSELVWRSQLMNTLTRVELAFYDLLLARDSVRVQAQALDLANELLAANRERIKQGVLAALDEKQAESQVSVQRSVLLTAQRTVSVQENLLKGLLSDHIDAWIDVSIQPQGELEAVRQPVQRSESWRRGMAQRPDLLQARADIERLGYIVRFNRNQTYPQLDAVGSYGHGGSANEFSGTLGQWGRGSSPFHSYGVQMSLPLSGRSVREGLRVAKSEKEQSALRLRQLEQEILLEIDNAVRAVELNFERVGTTRQAREFAEAALRAEQTKMDTGRSTSFVVLQLQRDLTSARSEESRALAEYNRALAQLALGEGSVFERHQMDVVVK
jgi:outer membrane protein